MPTNPRTGSLFPGCLLSIPLLFSLTAYLFSQLYLPIYRPVQVELSFPISSVSGVSSCIIILHSGICGSSFPFASSQPVRADGSHTSGNGGKAALPGVQTWSSCAETVPCCSHGLELNCYRQSFLPSEEEKDKRLNASQ